MSPLLTQREAAQLLRLSERTTVTPARSVMARRLSRLAIASAIGFRTSRHGLRLGLLAAQVTSCLTREAYLNDVMTHPLSDKHCANGE